jgi:hypothetical protein
MGTEPVVEIGKDNAYADDGTLTFTGNNIYAPNALYEVDGVLMSLSAFNTLTGGTNTEVIQEWNDPVNGDFSTETPPQVLTYDPAEPIYQTITNTNPDPDVAYYTQATKYRVVLETKMVSTGSAQRFCDGAASGGYNASYAWAGFNATGQLVLFNTSGCTIDGTSYASGDDISAYIDDGVIHTVSITIIATKRIGAIGINHNTTGGYAGEIYSAELLNDSDSAVIANFAMDEIKLDGDTETSNGIVLTHYNTTGADWSSR